MGGLTSQFERLFVGTKADTVGVQFPVALTTCAFPKTLLRNNDRSRRFCMRPVTGNHWQLLETMTMEKALFYSTIVPSSIHLYSHRRQARDSKVLYTMMLRTSFVRLTFCPLTLLALLLSTASAEEEDYCNICGQGNLIGFSTGIVSFEYEGVQRTNNCQTWQTIVMNPVAISDDFCRNEMLVYTLPVSLI